MKSARYLKSHLFGISRQLQSVKCMGHRHGQGNRPAPRKDNRAVVSPAGPSHHFAWWQLADRGDKTASRGDTL